MALGRISLLSWALVAVGLSMCMQLSPGQAEAYCIRESSADPGDCGEACCARRAASSTRQIVRLPEDECQIPAPPLAEVRGAHLTLGPFFWDVHLLMSCRGPSHLHRKYLHSPQRDECFQDQERQPVLGAVEPCTVECHREECPLQGVPAFAARREGCVQDVSPWLASNVVRCPAQEEDSCSCGHHKEIIYG